MARGEVWLRGWGAAVSAPAEIPRAGLVVLAMVGEGGADGVAGHCTQQARAMHL